MHIVPLTVSVIMLGSELRGLEALQSAGHLWDFPLESVMMRHKMLALETDLDFNLTSVTCANQDTSLGWLSASVKWE